jgi:hypothetical protein
MFKKIFFSQVFLPHIQKLPEEDIKVLIGDNLAAHLSPVVTDLCQQHNIRSVALNIEYDVRYRTYGYTGMGSVGTVRYGGVKRLRYGSTGTKPFIMLKSVPGSFSYRRIPPIFSSLWTWPHSRP